MIDGVDAVHAYVVEEESDRLPPTRPPRVVLAAALATLCAVAALIVVLHGGDAAPKGPSAPAWSPAPDVLRGFAVRFACAAPCDSLRLRVRLKDPAARVWATVDRRTYALEDAVGGGRSYAAVLPGARFHG